MFVFRALILLTCIAFTVPVESNAQTVPAFTSLPVETGQYGSGYSYNITTSDVESHPRTISLASGTLPAGLTLLDNADGTALLSGTPSESGLFTFELGVTDVDGTALQEINLDISKAPLTATADDQTKVYGTANPVLTIDYVGFVNGDNVTDITEPTINTTADASSAVGSYPITLSGGSATNYTLTLVDGTLAVTPAALTATADDQTKVYGTTNPTLTIDYAGFVNGDDATDITAPTINTTADVSTSVGSYPITLSGGSAANYTLTLVDGSLSVTPASLTATAYNQTKVYGASNPGLTIQYAGFVNGDDATDITEPTINTTVDASSAVGSYPITLSGGSATNYTLTLVDGTLSVTPAALIATADDQTKVYGASNPTLTIAYAGFVNGDDATDITEPTISTTADASSAVGSYPITLSGGSAANYTLTLVDGSLSVTPAALTATADDQTKVYGTANPGLTIQYAGFVNGDDATNITAPTINTTADASSAVGSYPITLSGGSATNYTLTLVDGSLSVTPAALTATADDQTKVYGTVNPGLTIQYAGFVNGDNATDITAPTINTAADASSAVGSYPITLSGGSATNYTLTLVDATLAVTPAALTATADDQTKVYGTANPTLTIDYAGFVNGDNATAITEPTINTIADASSSVGSYSITLSGGSATNYTLTLVDGTLSVTPAALIATADDQAKVYGTANPTLTIDYVGFVNGDDATDITEPTISTAADASSAVGSYPITLSGGSATNYTLTLVDGSLTVTPASLTATADDQTKVYGASNPGLTIQYAGFVNGDDATDITAPTISTTANASSALGSYPITLSGGSATNYTMTLVDGTLSVTPAALIATAEDQTKVYGASNPGLTIQYAGFVNGDDATDITEPTISTAADASSAVGSYPITLSGGSATNYTLTLVDGSLTVTPASLTATADDQTKVYGTANPTLTIDYAGFVNGDDATDITEPIINTTADANSTVGSYPITLSGGSATNYTLTLVDGTLSVTPAALTATADDQMKVYGNTNPTLTIDYAGFVNGDDATDITAPTINTTADASSAVGSYPITLSGGSATNYTLTLIDGTLSVTPATLTATADDQTKVYGTSNPTLTIDYAGFVNGDDATDITEPTISTTADASSAVGSYPITLSGGSATNYTLTLMDGTLSVTPAALTATADDQTKVYGTTNPTLTIAYAGFVNGDDVTDITAPTINTTADASSAVGSYPITLSGGSATNYTLTLIDGTLSVTPAALIATAEDQTKVYGTTNPVLTIDYAGFVNGDDATGITAPTISTTADASSIVGSYPITLSGGSASNYTLTLVDGTLSVTPAALTATADDQTKVYGTANPTLTIDYAGFVNGDDATDITAPTISTTADASSAVGSYPITLSGGSATNYTLTLVDGTLSVTPASLTATADDQTKVYGTANPVLTIDYAGFVNGDDATDITEPTISTTADASSAVGSYPITLSGGSATNYTLTLIDGSLTVTPASLTATADDQTKVYGTANPGLTIQYAGFVNGDDATDIAEPSINTTADASSAVGSYPITLSGGSATNYTLTLVDGSLTISKATLIATADNKSRIYNTSNPLLTVSYSGFVNSDNAGNLDVPPTGSTTATISSNVGTYPISFAGGVDNNYNFTYVDGELSILKATATVDVDNLVFTYDGFSKSSTVSTVPSGLTVILTYDGSTTSPINADTYSVEGTVDDTNYDGVGSGTLTINKATALVSISNLYQNYDGSPKPVTVTTNPAGLTTDITYNGSLSVPSARGSYTVAANVEANNYEGSDTETLIINGAPNTSGILDIAVQEDASNTAINLYNAFSDVEDADADLIYSISANTNPGLFSQVFISNGINTLDYEENQYGSTNITVRATDLGGLFVETTYEVTVSPVQDDPEFISSPVTGAVQGQLYEYNIEAGDPDPDDVLSIISALQLPDWLSLTDNGDGTATLTGIPSNSDVGSNPGIALTVDDGNGNDDTQLFNIAISNANDAPYFTSTALVASTEGIAYTYFINTDDDDTGDVLTLSAPILPDWLILTDNGDGTGQITGTPDNDDVGANVVQLRVTDNSNAFTNQDFTIVVENANDAPSITSLPVTSATEDEFYEYNVTSDDPDVGDNLELRALSKPAWLTFTDNGNGTGLLSGTPTNSNVGSSSIVINVEDQDGANSNQNFTLTVQNVNDKPIFTSSAVTAALQDNLYTYNITTTDPDAGDTRAITASLLPDWLVLTDNGNGTATLSGTPDNGDLGANPVVLLVKDVANFSSEQSFTINVDNANDPPAFTSSPITTGTEDQLYTYNISTSDPDAGDTRTISALSIPSWLTLIDNGDGTAELTGTPLNQHVGNVSIVLNVRDALGANVNQNFTLNIVNTNDDPIFQSTPITSAVQSIAYNYQVSVDDPDAGDNVTLTATTLPAWLDFTDNGNGSGSLFGTPTNGDLGSHPVTIRALDENGGDVYQNFTINVDNSNDPPAFTSSPITSATEDELYLYNITTTDPDIGDVLEIEALVLPAWLTLSDNGDGTATLEGTPLNANVGIADVVLELTDAQGISVNQNFSIVVSNTNDPPVFTSSPITGAIQDQNYTYNIITSDPDLSDSRSIIASIKPPWLSLIDNGNGTATLQGVPSNTDLGSNNVTLEVSDLSGAITTQNFVINVDNANDPPSFTSTPVTMATEDVLYEYNLTTSDPDIGDTRTLTALSLPTWLSLTDNGDGTGLLSGVPANDDVGNFNVVLNVEDGVGANINQNFTLNVKNTNDAPFFSSSPVPVAVQDVLYTYNITTGDPDVGDSRNIIASTLPSWLNFTDHGDGTAVLSGTPSNANLGEHQVVLNVEDDEQAAVDQVFTINVDNANDPPSFESTPITSVLEDDSYNYAISTSDPDVGDIQYITALSKPSWLNLIDNGDGTAVLSGVPKNEDVGIVNVVLNVEDGIGANVNQNFSITVTNTNDAPGFTSSPVTGAIQDVQYNYSIQTTDPDIGDTRTIESNTLPAWLTLSDNGDGTASLQGTPTNSNLGLNTVSIKVTDMSGASVNQVFDINVDNQNDPPAFTSSPVTIAKEDVLYTYNITTSDPDAGDTRSINALSLPVWLGLTDNGDGTAILQGTPLNADVGSDNVVLQVIDALGSEDGQSFSITIENVNDAPAFTSTPVVSAQQDIAYNYDITTSDPDVGDTRAISITNKPSWLVFNDNGNGTATLSGTPSNADLGDYEITLTVEDESGVAIDQVFTLTVENANDPPVFTSTPITNAIEDSPYTYNITATDPDLDDVLTIVALSKPSWLMLLDNGDGIATLSGTPLNSNVGDNEVVLNVEDDSGANINQSFTIVVANTNDEPTITSSPILSAQQGLTYTYNITTSDVDVGDNLTITSTLTLPGWLGLTDNGDGTAVLSGTPQNSDLGSFNISIKVEDLAGSADNQAFTLVVDNSNDPPTFDSTPIITTNEDDLFEYEILTSDPDVGDMLSINIIDKPTWLTFEDFGDNTALLSGIALNEHVGVHEIKLRVTDLAGQTVQQNFNLEVINTNDAPVFTSTPQLEIDEDATYEYNVTVQDVDLGNSLTITAEILPDWLSFLDNGDGTAIIEGTPENDDVGVHDIKIRVSDSQGGIVDQDISLNVINTNDPPEITSNPVLSVLEDDNYAYEITVADPDVGDTFDVTLDNLPEWMVLFEDTDGTVSLLGSPLNEHVGLHDISLTVSDEDGATDIQTFEIEVINTNDDPVFVSTPIIRVVLGQSYSYEVVVNDPDVNDVINLSAELPSYLTFTDNGNGQGEVQGTITSEAFTQNQITIRASDLEGSASEQLYALQVNTPPEVNDFSITTDEDVPFVFTESDFSDNYSDDENDLLSEIEIESLPQRGGLLLNNQEVVLGQVIVANDLDDLTFHPDLNFFGEDEFTWAASDGFSYSDEIATVSISIVAVNDSPQLITGRQDDILPDLEYALGDPAIILVNEGEIDVRDEDEGDLIAMAQIIIKENYANGDYLEIDEAAASITTSFDSEAGIFTISGEASEATYSRVLEQMKFGSPVSGEAQLSDKKIEITVVDNNGAISNVVSRLVKITEVFPELDIVNAFTPNDDGVNDTWEIENLQFYTDIKISVYTKEGTRVFSCNAQDCAWDGTFKGTELPGGPYLYTIDLNNNRRSYKGTVTILK